MFMVLGIIIIVVILVVWVIFQTPLNLPVQQGSIDALNNMSHWMSEKLGPNWPIILSIMVILLLMVLMLTERRS